MSNAEEYDPATGTFRPIGQKSRVTAAPKPAPAGSDGLSETGKRYGVLYEVFEDGLKSPSAKYMEYGAKAIIVIVFLLLLYEAISYRIALS